MWAKQITCALTDPLFESFGNEERTSLRMKTSILLPALLLALIAVYPSMGLYFHIRETEEKCFIEEVPDETMVVGMLYSKKCFYMWKQGAHHRL